MNQIVRTLIESYRNHAIGVSKLRAKQDALAEELVKLCPVKVDDLYTVPVGQHYSGKSMIVRRIGFDGAYKSYIVMRDFVERTGWVVSGILVKKDGTKGVTDLKAFIEWKED